MTIKRIGAAGAAAFFLASPANAVLVTSLPDYDSVFGPACGGGSCVIAAAEARNGDNGATPQENELQIGAATNVPPANAINITNQPGYWDGNETAFSLRYDAVSDVLTFTYDNLPMTFGVDLASAESLFLRAASASTGPATVVSDLELTMFGQPTASIGVLTGDDSADYLAISDFDFNTNWVLEGMLAMTGDSGFPNARPSFQIQLTNVVVPIPGAALLFATGLGLLGMRRKKKAA